MCRYSSEMPIKLWRRSVNIKYLWVYIACFGLSRIGFLVCYLNKTIKIKVFVER